MANGRGQEAANWEQSHRFASASTGWAGNMGTETNSTTKTSDGIPFRPTLAAEVIGWLGAAQSGSTEVINNLADVSAEGSNEEVNTAWDDFWAL